MSEEEYLFTILVFRHGDTIYPHLSADEAPEVPMKMTKLAALEQFPGEGFLNFLKRANAVMSLFATRNNCDFVELSCSETL